MLSIKYMFDSLFRVDLLENFISILSQASSKQHDFKDLGHLKQEDIQSESLCYIYLFQRAFNVDFNREIIVFSLFEGTMKQCLIEVQNKCLCLGWRSRWNQRLYFAFPFFEFFNFFGYFRFVDIILQLLWFLAERKQVFQAIGILLHQISLELYLFYAVLLLARCLISLDARIVLLRNFCNIPE